MVSIHVSFPNTSSSHASLEIEAAHVRGRESERLWLFGGENMILKRAPYLAIFWVPFFIEIITHNQINGNKTRKAM